MKSVRSSIDTQALASAVSKPGIDPRCWVCLAIVGKEQGYDADHGVFVDVILQPSGEEETAFLGSEWTGGNAAGYFPVAEGDIVLCTVIQGDTAHGVVIIKKLWSPSEKPPPELEDGDTPGEPTRDAIIRVKDGQQLRIVAQEGASINLEVDGSGKVNIKSTGQSEVEVTSESAIRANAPEVFVGDGDGRPVARVGDIITGSVNALGNLGAPIIPTPPAQPTASGGVAFVGQITSGSSSAKAGS